MVAAVDTAAELVPVGTEARPAAVVAELVDMVARPVEDLLMAVVPCKLLVDTVDK